MITVLSPAKSLDLARSVATPRATQPRFLDRSETLVEKLRTYSPGRLAKLMNVSADLATLNAERYAAWERPFTSRNARKAALVFDGDVYAGLDAATLTKDDFAFAQDHLRILSGLYGVLRPLDLIQPYRLEMGTPLRVARKKDLYGFWGDELSDSVRDELAAHDSPVLVNLASDEYFKALRGIDVRVIKPVFKEKRGGSYKVISFLAKKARGMMAREIVRGRIDEPEGLKRFDAEGYAYSAKRSKGDEWVFAR